MAAGSRTAAMGIRTTLIRECHPGKTGESMFSRFGVQCTLYRFDIGHVTLGIIVPRAYSQLLAGSGHPAADILCRLKNNQSVVQFELWDRGLWFGASCGFVGPWRL